MKLPCSRVCLQGCFTLWGSGVLELIFPLETRGQKSDSQICPLWFYFINLLFFWLRWVFIAAAPWLSKVWCMGFSLGWLLQSWSTSSRAQTQ